MASLRALLSLACLTSLLVAASASASPVVVARLQASGDDGGQGERLDATLREEARHVVGDRLIPAAPPRPTTCRTDTACAAALATAYGASSVVLTSYRSHDGAHELQVGLYDRRGQELGIAARSLSTPPDGRVLRGALAELFEPSTYVGRLRIQNAPPGAQVKVDRLPLSTAEMLQPYALSVGTHLVEVRAPEHVTLVREIVIAYDEELVFDAALVSSEAASLAAEGVVRAPPPVPWWPAAITGGVTALATTVAVVAGIDWATTSWEIQQHNAGIQNVPLGEHQLDPHRYAADALPREIDERQLAMLRGAVRTDLVIMAVAGSVAVVAGAATAALAARFLTADESAEEPADEPVGEMP